MLSGFRTRQPRRTAFVAWSVLLVAAALPTLCSSQEHSQRLILKDGSYQLVTKYEIQGDRVRYFSSERGEWEELPKSLIDWPATESYEKDRAAAAASPEAVQLDKEAAHERELEQKQLPQVAPGLRLPEPSGVFLLEAFDGQPQLVEIQQSGGDVHRSAKGNIFRSAIPLAGVKQTVELDGAHASNQSHVGVPSLYINIDSPLDAIAPADTRGSAQTSAQPQQAQQPQKAEVPYDQFRIVRAEVKGGKRVVLDLKLGPDGKVKQDQRYVKTTIDRVTGGWLKLTPTEPLAPGEYALVEMVTGQGINLGVWDFGVNPKAPANANPWKPEATEEAKPQQAPH